LGPEVILVTRAGVV